MGDSVTPNREFHPPPGRRRHRYYIVRCTRRTKVALAELGGDCPAHDGIAYGAEYGRKGQLMLISRKDGIVPVGAMVASLCVTGCVEQTGPTRAGRTAEERQQHIVVGAFGGASGDRRRMDFDYWNLQFIHEDVAVSTVFLGDSITEYWSLSAYFVPSDGVLVNRGICSDTAANILERFAADVVQLRPRNIVILAGLNDVSHALGKNLTDDEIVDEVTAVLEKLMDASRRAGITTLMCSLTSAAAGSERHARFAAIVPRINDALGAACVAKGCIYVDYASAVNDTRGFLRRGLTGDGIHPHHKGYRMMTKVLLAAAKANGVRL